MISITKIIAQKLKNVEIGMDKNDVYVQLLYGDNIWNHVTTVLDEAGDKAEWEYNLLRDTHMKFTLPVENLIYTDGSNSKSSGNLSITVMDKNNFDFVQIVFFAESYWRKNSSCFLLHWIASSFSQIAF